jgi:hypothetical protein
MKQTQIHHKLPRSKGGTDHPSNLVELTLYEHAEVHALDFVNGGEQFDFRNPFWGLLQAEDPKLALAVRREARRRREGKPGFLQGRTGPAHPKFGVVESEETRDLKSKAHTGKPKSPEHKEKLRTHLLEKCKNQFAGKTHTEESKLKMSEAMKSKRFRCTVTGFESTPGALTGYQKARGIDPSNRIQII